MPQATDQHTTTNPVPSAYARMSIRHLSVLFAAYKASIAGLDGIYNQPRAKGVDAIEDEIERLTNTMSQVVDEIESRTPTNSSDAEKCFDVLVTYWGAICGDYAKATSIAVKLLPLIARQTDTSH